MGKLRVVMRRKAARSQAITARVEQGYFLSTHAFPDLRQKSEIRQ